MSGEQYRRGRSKTNLHILRGAHVERRRFHVSASRTECFIARACRMIPFGRPDYHADVTLSETGLQRYIYTACHSKALTNKPAHTIGTLFHTENVNKSTGYIDQKLYAMMASPAATC